MRKSFKKIRILLVLSLSTLLLSCGSQNTKPEGHAPMIIESYAVSAVRPGQTWKVFLHTKDIDGDMDYIRFMVYLPDIGMSPTTFIEVKKKYRGEFTGYFCLNTPAENTLIGKKFILKAIVRDEQGNKSKPVTLAATLESVPKEEISERWQTGDIYLISRKMVDISDLDQWRSHTRTSGGDTHYALIYVAGGLISMY